MKKKPSKTAKKKLPAKRASVAKRPVKKRVPARKGAAKKAVAKKSPAKKAVRKVQVKRVPAKAGPKPRPAAKAKPAGVAPKAAPAPSLADELASLSPLQRTRIEHMIRAAERSPSGTTLVMLGTGMPRPDPMCFGPSTAVVYNGRVFLFDAGPGVMRRVAAARLSIRGPEAVFITHLHSDHTLGYPDLIFTTWVMGRKQKLQAYGPYGLKKMTKHILAAWREDIDVRIKGLERQTKTGYRVDVHEFDGGLIYDHEGVRITAIPVLHGCWKQAFGFRIDTPDRSIVISGDTRPSPALAEASKDVDVLVHEVYPASQVAPEIRVGGEVWPSYMREFHTSDRELGVIASLAQPKLLVLHHIVRHGNDDEELASSIRAGGYNGDIVVARDLDRY
jgi:ribonuclease BN (tRNA processing enzyme)